VHSGSAFPFSTRAATLPRLQKDVGGSSPTSYLAPDAAATCDNLPSEEPSILTDPETVVINGERRPRLVWPRFDAGSVALFSGIAALVSGLGVFGVLSTFVAQRTRELGLRLALGADLAAVRRLVLSQLGWPARRRTRRRDVVGAARCPGRLGFSVQMLGDFHPFAENLGAVHCMKKYLARL
jgi:hypothetical protein